MRSLVDTVIEQQREADMKAGDERRAKPTKRQIKTTVPRKPGRPGRTILDNVGGVFSCCREAGLAHGINQTTVRRMLSGYLKNKFGFKYL